jgi:adenine phosphoribosyltransferase
MHTDGVTHSDRVIVMDDLLATGGTAAASCELIEKVGAKVAGFGFVIELSFLEGRSKLNGRQITSLVTF